MSKKKSKKRPYFDPNRKDCHHLLWMARNYNAGWAKVLRNNDYLKVMIPQMTLHREIHFQIANIPPPSNKACKEAFEKINRGLINGVLDCKFDKIEARLQVLIDLWGEDFPSTVKALKKQQKVVRNFYHKGD